MQNQANSSAYRGSECELEVPNKIVCQLNSENSSYISQFYVKNKLSQTIYIEISSTFGKFLQINFPICKLSAGESKEFKVRIRPPNQIYPQQFIVINYFPAEMDQKLSFLSAKFKVARIGLHFNSQIIQDESIDKILKQQSQNAIISARSLQQEHQWEAALVMADQAFTLYRRNLESLIIMAEVYIIQSQLQKASNALQIFGCFDSTTLHYKAIILKAQIAVFYLNSTQQYNNLQAIKYIMKMLKQATQQNMMDEQYQNLSNQAMTKLNQLKHAILSTLQHSSQIVQLLQKAINEYEQHQQIHSHFKTKVQFEQAIKKLIKQNKQADNQTPQYALDPINYVNHEPVLTPTGLSYEKQFMINFFKKHGPQDPFTRHYLDPNSVLNNFTLKSLVRNNSNLGAWIKYQEKATKF